MSLIEKKLTPAQWKERLTSENTPITLAEYQTGALIRLLAQILDATQALRHLEGMVGAIDEAFSRHDSEYASSAVVREALDSHRRTLSGLTDANPDIASVLSAVAALTAPGKR